MTVLAQAVTTTSQKTWGLSAPLAASTTHLQVDSEIVAVTNLTTRQSMFVAENPLQCRVKRGQAGTTAATHFQGATVTELIDPNFTGGGGGGVSVDNTVDPPFNAATLKAPGATQDGDQASMVPAIVSADDPGAVGAGFLWLQTGAGGGGSTTVKLWIRRADNTTWIAVTLVTQGTGTAILDSEDGAAEFELGASGANSNLATDGQLSIRNYGGSVNAQIRLVPNTGLLLMNLPTSDPGVAEAIWNDSGTLKVSAG